jgi:hypothetical protein
MFSYGTNLNGWLIQRVDGSVLFNGNSLGDETISSNNHEWFDTRLAYDFVTDSGSLLANRVNGDGNWSTIAGFTGSDLGLTLAMDDPEEWTGLLLRMDHSSSNFDDIVVSASSIPEPSTFFLMSLGLLSLGPVGWRRRRRR